MTNLSHPVALLLFFLTFSGLPKTDTTAVKAQLSIEIGHRTKEESSEDIPWSYRRKLSWNDYLCEPERHTDAVASTSTSLGLAYQIEKGALTYQITCDFSKTKSWVIMKTPYILAHEQGHFDITELYARKLNEALQEYELNPRTYKQDINNIYESIVQEKEDMQEQYDDESDHSRNKKVQYEWLDKIDRMMNETEPFANYP